MLNAGSLQRERRDAVFLAALRLRVTALRVFIGREEARETMPPVRKVIFLLRPESADVTALAPRRARLALLRAALRTGLATSMSPVSDRFLRRLKMPNM